MVKTIIITKGYRNYFPEEQTTDEIKRAREGGREEREDGEIRSQAPLRQLAEINHSRVLAHRNKSFRLPLFGAVQGRSGTRDRGKINPPTWLS